MALLHRKASGRLFVFIVLASLFGGCAVLKLPYTLVKGTVKATVWTMKTTYQVTAGTTKIIYKIGEFTFVVIKAPLTWPLAHKEIESIDGMPPKEAIRKGKVKKSPYKVKGKTYYPMSEKEAQNYKETGIASWYGYESTKKGGDSMTANGEVFDPEGLTAAHKLLPLPVYVQVTNLENGKKIIVRVNDRGPFPSDYNAESGKRIIDLSLGAAKRLGFHKSGTAKVKVETIQVREEKG